MCRGSTFIYARLIQATEVPTRPYSHIDVVFVYYVTERIVWGEELMKPMVVDIGDQHLEGNRYKHEFVTRNNKFANTNFMARLTFRVIGQNTIYSCFKN